MGSLPFLRKVCRRVLILHSYRDGRGKVCHRRLGHFSDAAGLEHELRDLPQRCPELNWDEVRLRQQAQKLLTGPSPNPTSGQRARAALRTLMNWLAEAKDPGQLGPELATLRDRLHEVELEQAENPLNQARSALPSRRKRFDPSDSKARAYLETLDEMAQLQQQPEEKAQILAERVQAYPSPQALLQYGVALQQLGRHREAIEQYKRVPDEISHRHYNLCSIYWCLGDFDEALVHLLRGLARQPDTAEALFRMHQGRPVLRGGQYWERFG